MKAGRWPRQPEASNTGPSVQEAQGEAGGNGKPAGGHFITAPRKYVVASQQSV